MYGPDCMIADLPQRIDASLRVYRKSQARQVAFDLREVTHTPYITSL